LCLKLIRLPSKLGFTDEYRLETARPLPDSALSLQRVLQQQASLPAFWLPLF
jgi:hypothetical protein